MGDESSGDFVVQQHRAERAGLHHDFRLAMGGVLKSWAVPKGVPTESGIKRLAIQVADHPIGYKDFSGVISEGYGKGEVEIWDDGKYTLINQSPEYLFFQLRGDKLKGNYHMRHWKGSQWLLWKQ